MHSAALKINLFLGSSRRLISHRCLELRQHGPLGPKKKIYNTATPSPASPSPHPYLCAECSWMCRGKPLIEATSQTFACVCDIFSPLPSRLPSSPPSVLRFLEFTGHALDSRHSECRGYLARGSRPVRLIRDVDGRRRLIRLLLSVM